MGNLLAFDNNTERYREIAESYAEKGSYEKALSFLHAAYKKDSKNLGLIADIADAYADAGLYEMSNVYWFRYLDKAPEIKKPTAYCELAINYFYMNQPFVSGYYFHKKAEITGNGSDDILEEEVKEQLRAGFDDLRKFRIVYPYSRADYSREVKDAKRAISIGDYKKAIGILSSVPEESPAYKDAWDDLAIAHFLAGNIDEGIKVTKDKIKKDGESVSAYCNLSSMYSQKKDADKGAYYYEKAISLTPSGVEDEYKLATCSLENGRHEKGAEYIKNILIDRPYDLNLRHLLGIALINSGDYSSAKEQFAYIVLFDPENEVDGYYLGLCGDLSRGVSAAQKLLPLKYEEDVPSAEFKARLKKINKIATNISAGKVPSSAEDFAVLRWGIDCGEEDVEKAAAYALCCSRKKSATDFLFTKLLDPDFPDNIKRAVIYLLLMNGVKAKTGVVSGDVYIKIRLRVPDFGDLAETVGMRSAYALCYSRMTFTGIPDADKLYDGAKLLYKRLCEKHFNISDFAEEELALFTVVFSKLDIIDMKGLLPLFSVDEERFDRLKKILGDVR